MVAGVTDDYLCGFGRMMREKALAERCPEPEPRPALPPAELWRRALDLAIDGKPSGSYLSRHLGVGWEEANGLLERMARHGIVSAPDAAGRRTVLTPRRIWLVSSDS